MNNWHNDLHQDAGWVTDEPSPELDPGQIKVSQPSCRICGTRTGLHGFSFDKKKT